jgi:hypothetical protein
MTKFVKIIFILLPAVAAAFLSGCATEKQGLVLNPVGPPPSPSSPASSGAGALVVYSADKVNADFNARDPDRREYSDYQIFTATGKLLRWVRNSSGTILQDPATVSLPPGKYRVVARANGYGHVTIPVFIVAQQKTILHLEGGNPWPDASIFNPTNAVYLPDGQAVGWKAASAF